MRHPSTITLLLLLAGGVGYVLGTGGREASASPVLMEDGNGTYVTHDQNGSTLTMWQFQQGVLTRATEYAKTNESSDDVTALRVTYFAPRAKK